MSSTVRISRSERARTRGERALAMAEKYQAGATLQEIGDYYGITRERVRQLMTRELGVTRKDGGHALRGRQRLAVKGSRRDARYLGKHGMTYAEYWAINRGYDCREESPAAKFRRQLANSAKRGIPWKLTFAEWWSIWERSGKWSERGRGRGYVMARHGDRGGYETGNVKIISGTENQSEYIRRYWKQVRSGDRAPPQGPAKTAPYQALTVGQTLTLDASGRSPQALRSNALAAAQKNGWKVKTSVRGTDVTLTRIS